MTGYLLEFGQALLALILAPGLVGFVRWVKARLQNRRGAPIWLPYFELKKLFSKEVVMSNNASWLFRVAPYIVFGSALAVTRINFNTTSPYYITRTDIAFSTTVTFSTTLAANTYDLQSVLTHEIGHADLAARLPAGIEPAHDGLILEVSP